MQHSFEDSAGSSKRARIDQVDAKDGEHNRYRRYQAIYSEIEPETSVLRLDREARGGWGGVDGVGKVNGADELLTRKSWLDVILIMGGDKR